MEDQHSNGDVSSLHIEPGMQARGVLNGSIQRNYYNAIGRMGAMDIRAISYATMIKIFHVRLKPGRLAIYMCQQPMIAFAIFAMSFKVDRCATTVSSIHSSNGRSGDVASIRCGYF